MNRTRRSLLPLAPALLIVASISLAGDPAPEAAPALSSSLDALRGAALDAQERSRVEFIVATIALNEAKQQGQQAILGLEQRKAGWSKCWQSARPLSQVSTQAKEDLRRHMELERARSQSTSQALNAVLERELDRSRPRVEASLRDLLAAIARYDQAALGVNDPLVAKARKHASAAAKAARAQLAELGVSLDEDPGAAGRVREGSSD